MEIGIHLKQIGPFADQVIWLPDSKFVALVGPNGTGKTTALEALAYCLLKPGAKNEVDYTKWLADRLKARRRTPDAQLPNLVSKPGADESIQDPFWISDDWRVMRYYPITRAIRPTRVPGPRKQSLRAQNPENPAEQFKQWIVNQYFFRYEKSWGGRHGEMLRMFTGAMSAFFSELYPQGLHFAGVTPEMEVMFDPGTGPAPLETLASGVQSLLSIIADLTIQLDEAYPDLDNPLLGAALALIDELDLHLHPAWQQTVAKGLQKMFPNTTFVISTHSPLVVNDVKPGSLILFSLTPQATVEVEQGHMVTEGWVAEQIYRKVFGLRSSRNPEVQTQLDHYRKVLREFIRTESPERKAELAQLEASLKPFLAPGDPALDLFQFEVLRDALKEVRQDETPTHPTD